MELSLPDRKAVPPAEQHICAAPCSEAPALRGWGGWVGIPRPSAPLCSLWEKEEEEETLNTCGKGTEGSHRPRGKRQGAFWGPFPGKLAWFYPSLGSGGPAGSVVRMGTYRNFVS